MFHRKHIKVIAPFALVGSVVVACSSAPVPAPTGGSKNSDSNSNSDDNGDTAASPPAAATTAAPITPPTVDPTTCKAKTTAGDCATCCGETDSTFAASDKNFDDCACAGPCASACTAYCGNRNSDPNDACLKCLDADATEASCGKAADDICAADPACKNVGACEDAAGCDDKPDPDAPDGG